MSEPRPAAHRPTATPPISTSTGTSTAAAAPPADAPAPRPLGLSATQVAGGALAAVTATVAASYFGVAGTLVGAALGSVVSTIAAALYSTSLTRAARVSKVLVVRPAGSGTGPLEASAQDPSAVPPVVPPEPLVEDTPWWRRLAWKPVALVAGLLFVGTLAVVQVSELALGRPLSNPSGSGTTLTNIGGGGSPVPDSPPATPSPSVPSPTDTPSPAGTPTPSTSAPSGTPTTTPGSPAPTSPPSPSTTASPTEGSPPPPSPSASVPTPVR
jgi:hypothetical protein